MAELQEGRDKNHSCRQKTTTKQHCAKGIGPNVQLGANAWQQRNHNQNRNQQESQRRRLAQKPLNPLPANLARRRWLRPLLRLMSRSVSPWTMPSPGFAPAQKKLIPASATT